MLYFILLGSLCGFITLVAFVLHKIKFGRLVKLLKDHDITF